MDTKETKVKNENKAVIKLAKKMTDEVKLFTAYRAGNNLFLYSTVADGDGKYVSLSFKEAHKDHGDYLVSNVVKHETVDDARKAANELRNKYRKSMQSPDSIRNLHIDLTKVV